MPLTKTGQTILSQLMERHGKEKGKRIFHASLNKGTIPRKGVEKNR